MTQGSNEIEWFRDLLRRSKDVEARDPSTVLAWLDQKRKAPAFEAHLVGLSDLASWYVEERTGDVHSDSGAFFSIQGVRVTSEGGLREVSSWDQPIFTQKEGGVLALIAKQEGPEILFLLNAKAEPGNIGVFQLSPTVQASWSNLNRAHKGKRPPFTEVVLGEVPSRLVYESLHNEEGSRFWRKSNRNQIWLVDWSQTPLDYDPRSFVWASLSQIKAMILLDNIVNPYVKTIVAPL
jgi:oxidase EvaA